MAEVYNDDLDNDENDDDFEADENDGSDDDDLAEEEEGEDDGIYRIFSLPKMNGTIVFFIPFTKHLNVI